MRPVSLAIASILSCALLFAPAGRAAHAGASRSSFQVGTTVVDACSVGLDGATVQAACTPAVHAGEAMAAAAIGHSTVSLVAGGAPMRIASTAASMRAGSATIITFSF